jgi:S1-C subfamily serine protease
MLGTAIRRGAALVVAGALGAGIAVGIAAIAEDDAGGGTTTIVQQVASPTGDTSGIQVAAETEAPTDTESATEAGLSVQEIYRRAGPGVVQISALNDAAGEQQALGSGFVIDKAGHIVTNFHVVQGAGEIRVSFSGRDDSVAATLVGSDPSSDIAVLAVDLPATALTPLPLGDSDGVDVGDAVVAIGNPFGLDRTVTSGIVSAIQREITAPNGFPIDHVIQTDAAINHGNSGGPLLDDNGQVIGVNSQIETGGYAEGNVGVGFAVPIDTVKEVASQLIETGKVERAFLGVEMQTISKDAASDLRLAVDEGVLVATVRPGSPAAEAGLRGGDETAVVSGETWVLGGDVIVEADGTAVTDADQLREIVLAKQPGDSLSLRINRDGKALTLNVKLGRQPTTPTG